MADIGTMIAQAQNTFNFGYTFSGLCIGVLVGLTGVGGGSLMTPLLVLLFGIHPATAVGTDLIYAAITKTFGTAVHGHKRSIQWKIVGLLALGSVPASALTLYFLKQYGSTPEFALIIKKFLGVTLLITALMVLGRGYLTKYAKDHYETGHDNRNAILTIMTGLLLGFLVSLTSVGAGAIGVTALILLYPKLPILRIIGTDIAHAVPLTLFAGLGYLALGQVDFALLFSLLLGSIPGIILGSFLAPKAPEKALQIILAIVLVLVGYKLLAPK